MGKLIIRKKSVSIQSIHINNEQDWTNHLRTKKWFSEIVQDDFKIAF